MEYGIFTNIPGTWYSSMYTYTYTTCTQCLREDTGYISTNAETCGYLLFINYLVLALIRSTFCSCTTGSTTTDAPSCLLSATSRGGRTAAVRSNPFVVYTRCMHICDGFSDNCRVYDDI